VVCSVGYNPARLPKGYNLDEIKVGYVYTNLAVMDFGGKNHQMRLLSVHPGVTVEQVIENTSFEIEIPENVPVTAEPTDAQMMLIKELDPHNLRASVLR